MFIIWIAFLSFASSSSEIAFPSTACIGGNDNAGYYFLSENSQPNGCNGTSFCDGKGICRELEWKYIGGGIACRIPNYLNNTQCNLINLGKMGVDVGGTRTISTPNDFLTAYDDAPAPWRQVFGKEYICSYKYTGPNITIFDIWAKKTKTACTIFNESLQIYTALPKGSIVDGCNGVCDGIGLCREVYWKYNSTGIACRPGNTNNLSCNMDNLGVEGNMLIDVGFPQLGWGNIYNAIIAARGTSTPSIDMNSLLYSYDTSAPIGQRPCDLYTCQLGNEIGEICGNEVCEEEESSSSCSEDCGVTLYCGDGSCNNGESCSTCVGDCGSCSTNSGGSSGGGSSGGGSGGGGSSGGGSSIAPVYQGKTYTFDSSETNLGRSVEIQKKDIIKFYLEVQETQEEHSITLLDIQKDYISIKIQSEPIIETVNINETKKFEITGDEVYDVEITLNSIKNGKVNVSIKTINEEIEEQQSGLYEKIIASWKQITIIFIVAIALVMTIILRRKRKVKK